MVATAQVYDLEWYQSLARFRPFNERAMWAVLAHLGRPESMIDFGCGDAWMVRAARMAGVKPSIGVEFSRDVKRLYTKWARVLIADLTMPCDYGRTFELVVSLEVGEHLPAEAAPEYVRTLVRHTGKNLVFSAAAPGQGGDGHINTQPQEYWRDLLAKGGLVYNQDTTDRLRETWKWTTGPMFWLPQNVQVFDVAA